MAKYDSVASNNYWHIGDQLFLTDKKDTHNGPTVQLPNNDTISVTNTVHIPLSSSLIIHEKKAHIFDGMHSASLISLGQLYDNYCISILDKN